MKIEFGEKDALLVIDMLNDFIDEERGTLVVPGASRIVPRIAELVDVARSVGTPVIYVCDTHRTDDAEFRNWPAHAVKGSWGAEVVEPLLPLAGEHIVHKRRYSGFFGTDLELRLSELSVRKLYLTGVLTNICVWATALDAAERNFEVAVVSDAVASLSKETDEFVFRQLREVLQAEVI